MLARGHVRSPGSCGWWPARGCAGWALLLARAGCVAQRIPPPEFPPEPPVMSPAVLRPAHRQRGAAGGSVPGPSIGSCRCASFHPCLPVYDNAARFGGLTPGGPPPHPHPVPPACLCWTGRWACLRSVGAWAGWLCCTQRPDTITSLPNFSARRELAGTQAAEMSSGFLWFRAQPASVCIGQTPDIAAGDFPGCGR